MSYSQGSMLPAEFDYEYSLDILTRRITSYFRGYAGRFGLNAAMVEARYILNWGGFVNASFFIRDGKKTYYLKLASGESLIRLERWASVHKLLTERYHAPRMLDWIKIPSTPYQGLLFEYIPGQPADLAHQPAVLQGILSLLPQLHTDCDLASALSEQSQVKYKETSAGQGYTYVDCFSDVYVTRFEEDLVTIANNLPPFVSLERLNWMNDETRKVKSLANNLPAFQHPADAIIHGDLWPNNILVTDSGAWYIIDWDDLNLGDPALEYSILLGPLWLSGAITLTDAENYLPDFASGVRNDFLVRFQLYLRTLLLDEIIDSLADWVESSISPDHQAEVRTEKKQIHHKALEAYQRMY